ncbi:MAG: hypothetical protein DME00_12520 [Candidatus Rokuibacteriota bacterium]|nr:MAG: hypothetical protein DME00_12520 [Candidatus Rokubacteria bacterium]
MLNGERSILIVVPRGGQDACRSLSHTFADDSTVEVIVDRRLTDRRSGNGAHRPERRQGDRRTRPDADAELKVDRWIAVPRATGANRSSVRRPLSRVGATEPSAQAATG